MQSTRYMAANMLRQQPSVTMSLLRARATPMLRAHAQNTVRGFRQGGKKMMPMPVRYLHLLPLPSLADENRRKKSTPVNPALNPVARNQWQANIQAVSSPHHLPTPPLPQEDSPGVDPHRRRPVRGRVRRILQLAEEVLGG